MSARTLKCRNYAKCQTMIYPDSATGQCRPCYDQSVAASTPVAQVRQDRELERLRAELVLTTNKYKVAQADVRRLERELFAVAQIGDDPRSFDISPRESSGTSEGTVVVPLSDWHSEERVNPRSVSDLNDFNLDVCKARVTRLFQSILRLTRLLQQDIKIGDLVVPLLGDFISNSELHHGEHATNMQLEPMHAITFARDLLTSGINFLLEHSKLQLRFPCHSGNHGRTTGRTRPGNENGHSLEFLLYLHLASEFKNEKRVQFQVADGYHSYLQVYDQVLRFHHGHDVRYQGGVGGIYIPVNKAIAQWNKARHADLDVFGHFHQLRDGGNFVCNGSLIGYNAFALSIKADYEPPRQALFLLDKKRGRTCTWPVLV